MQKKDITQADVGTSIKTFGHNFLIEMVTREIHAVDRNRKGPRGKRVHFERRKQIYVHNKTNLYRDDFEVHSHVYIGHIPK